VSRRKRAQRKRLPSKLPPPASRRIIIGKPTEVQIAQLRQDAFALIDFSYLLNDFLWQNAALIILRVFIGEHPYPPLGPRGIAALVDESIDGQLKRGVPLAQAVEEARDVCAEMLRKKRDTIRRAHQRYGKRGATKPR